MLALLGTCIAALVLATTAFDNRTDIVNCQIYGDPNLTPFVLTNDGVPTTTACDLPTTPMILLRNKFTEVKILNQGGPNGLIVSFSIALFQEVTAEDDVCTFTEYDFRYNGRTFQCGSANISINSFMDIRFPEANLRINVDNWINHYRLNLWTSMENANKSRGLCVRGCPPLKPGLARSALSTSLSKDLTVSAMAGQLCDLYLQNFTGPQSLVPSRMASFVQETRRACVTDVTVMGEKKYAEEGVANIVSTLMSLNATSLAQIEGRMKQGLIMIERINRAADQASAKLIAGIKG